MAGKKGETTVANNNNGNQFREDEIIVLDQSRDGKMAKNIFPKIGGRRRLPHEENDQVSITTEIILYDENLAVVKSVGNVQKCLHGLTQKGSPATSHPSDREGPFLK